MLKDIFKFFSSLKLTVTCLVLGCVLVFWGTLAQVHLGLYKAQNEFFRSFLIYWQPAGASFQIPIFPGGYLLGAVLLINLLAAHLRYYQPGRRKIGIVLIHLGVMLLLVGQFLTDFLSRESALHLRIGETKNYSEADRAYELAVIDTTAKNSDEVVAIPCSRLAGGGSTEHRYSGRYPDRFHVCGSKCHPERDPVSSGLANPNCPCHDLDGNRRFDRNRDHYRGYRFNAPEYRGNR